MEEVVEEAVVGLVDELLEDQVVGQIDAQQVEEFQVHPQVGLEVLHQEAVRRKVQQAVKKLNHGQLVKLVH